jgi:hypothetical protein
MVAVLLTAAKEKELPSGWQHGGFSRRSQEVPGGRDILDCEWKSAQIELGFSIDLGVPWTGPPQ